MVEVKVSIDVGPALQKITGLSNRAADLSPVFKGPVDASVSQLFIKQFDTEGAFGGDRWAPLLPLTLRLRKERGHGQGGILRDTSRLWASLVKVGPESLLLISPHSYQRGTTVPYARFHQIGWTSTMIFGHLRSVAIQVPARPPVPKPIPAETVALWRRSILSYIAGGASAS